MSTRHDRESIYRTLHAEILDGTLGPAEPSILCLGVSQHEAKVVLVERTDCVMSGTLARMSS